MSSDSNTKTVLHLVFQRWPCVWRPRRNSIGRTRMCCFILASPTNAAAQKVAIGTSLRECMASTCKKLDWPSKQEFRSRNPSWYGIVPGSMTRIHALAYSGAAAHSGLARLWSPLVVTGMSLPTAFGVSLYRPRSRIPSLRISCLRRSICTP